MVSEPIVCEICGKQFKSTQGLAGHVQLKHAGSAQVKSRGRGGKHEERFAELREFADIRYKLIMSRYLELEIQRMEKEFYRSQLDAHPSAQAGAQPNVIVLPLTPQEADTLCPVCGGAIPTDYSDRRRTVQAQSEGVRGVYACPHCRSALSPSTR